MATNLLISWPDIVASGTAYDLPTGETYYPNTQVYGGDRTRRFRSSSAATSRAWSFDLGSGVTQEPNHVILGRIGASVARDTGTSAVRVKGSTVSNFASGYNNSANISTLTGAQAHDYVRTLSPGSAYRYWLVQLETTDSVIIEVGKIHIGNWLDLGRDPLYSSRISRGPLGNYSRRSALAFELRYEGVTDSARQDLQDKVISRAENPIFLYDTANSRALLGVQLLHCRIANIKQNATAINRNNLTLTVEEVI